ncbi:probable protein phosphatase 2C 26 isoform X1 [Salvia splendens]|uniref:probable protein phosphatase 2C 26 isoform X1 n=1 Tax=Salvia splendens TaxID=180675 RepID=UPI001C25ACDE|nr:probable protein phosphatase 2C 26 isoform X1 [Salvia splendens]
MAIQAALRPFSTANRLNPSISSVHKPKTLLCRASLSNLVGSEAGVCLSVGTHFIPHPDKVEKGGEDAFFVSNHRGGVIAVADGVSGWAEKDVNPALFSRELMAHASSLVEDEEVNYEPRSLIRKAHAATTSIGSATTVVAMLERNGILKMANVGDCGVRIIRRGQIVFSTSPQEHYFDCPFQLSSEAAGQTFLDATVMTVELMEEDTVVMGSDGLFDNVYDTEILAVVDSCDNVADAAKALANLAHSHSKDSSFDSPYSQEARARGFDVPWWNPIMPMFLIRICDAFEQGFDVPWWKKFMGMKLTGGKLDDITVIIGQVESSLSS